VEKNVKKIGWFRSVRGHSGSLATSPFNRAHTTSYSCFVVIQEIFSQASGRLMLESNMDGEVDERIKPECG